MPLLGCSSTRGYGLLPPKNAALAQSLQSSLALSAGVAKAKGAAARARVVVKYSLTAQADKCINSLYLSTFGIFREK